MSLPEPFVYPVVAHIRKHAPAGYKDYRDYKDWLRDDFSFRCVYCLHRETWSFGGSNLFSVDHVIPQSQDPGGVHECDYSNLVYACIACNTIRKAMKVMDPTADGFGLHITVNADGTVESLTREGKRLVEKLKLNRDDIVKERQRIFGILALKARHPADPDVKRDFYEHFRHPGNLPDLRRNPPHGPNPPGGNLLKANTENCYYAQFEQDLLPLILHLPAPIGRQY